MKNKLITVLFLILTNVVQKFTVVRSDYKDLTDLKLKLFYLKAIQTSRLLFISTLGVGVCLVFLFSGLILLHSTFFFYTSYSLEAKMWVGFIFATIYLLIAAVAFLYFFNMDKWLDIFHAQNIFKNFEKPPTSPKPEQ